MTPRPESPTPTQVGLPIPNRAYPVLELRDPCRGNPHQAPLQPGKAGTDALADRVRAIIAETNHPREFWPAVIAQAIRDEGLPFEEALTVLRELQEPTPCSAPKLRWRLPPRTRLDRWDERPALPCGRWVGQMNLDPVVDWGLSDGAARCLQVVVSLAGGAGRPLATLTSSIAKQLGRTTRTIQNYWTALVEAGFIEHTFDRRSGRVTITVTDLVKPPPMPEVKKPWPQLPNPKAGWKRPARGGAKFSSHIKAKVMNPFLIEESVQMAGAYFLPS